MPTSDAAHAVHADASSGRPARTLSVRGHLGVFTTALGAPLLVILAFLLWQVASNERSRLEENAASIAQDIAVAVDRDITGLLASLDVLALSSSLQSGDLAAFQRQAAKLAERQGIVPVLNDLDRNQLVNVRVPWGSPLGRTNLPWDEDAIRAGRPWVTDIFEGRVAKRPVFAVAAPVMRDGKPAYVLNFSLELDRLQKIIAEVAPPTGYTAAIVDRTGRFMARNVKPEQFVGQLASPDLRANTTARQGSWEGTSVEGVRVFGAYAQSGLAGFRAAVGVPSAELNAPLWRSLSLFALAGVLAGALSVVLGLILGKRITMPIQTLAERAALLGRGEPVEPLATGLLEADEVGAQLAAASASLRTREADLREANEEIQRFAYIVSHDLRSPLVNIMGFTTELEALRDDTFKRLEDLRAATTADASETERDKQLGEDIDEAIRFIKASISKMDRLINAILKLSREGRREFRAERVDMSQLLENIRATLAIQAETANAVITVGRLPPALSDRLALEQIFSNLVENALKYLRRGVPGRIEITGRDTAGGLVYEVKDNGRGIEARDLERVFELFRRSGAQDRPGEGIGLAHVRALVRRLGGKVTLTSTPGQGSTFAVTLPRRWLGGKEGKAA
ncbi:MAG: fhlA [Enterovirga sp.]|nr:fhlA [Enterovirga sp.]